MLEVSGNKSCTGIGQIVVIALWNAQYERITKWFLTQYWPALICLFVAVSLYLFLCVSLCVCVCAWRYSPQSNNIKVCVRLLWKWPQNAFGNRPCDALRHLSHKCAVRIHTHTHTRVCCVCVWVYIECFLIDQIHNPLIYTRTHTHTPHTPRAACAHLMLC